MKLRKISTQSLAAALVFMGCLAQADDLGPNLAIVGPQPGADASGFSNAKAVHDGDLATAPTATSTNYPTRVSVKWGGGGTAVTFNTAVIREQGNRVSSWQLVNDATGLVLASGSTIGPEKIVPLGTISSSKVNLMIIDASDAPIITEIEIYNIPYAGDPLDPEVVYGKVTDVGINAQSGIVSVKMSAPGSAHQPPACTNNERNYGLVYDSEVSKAVYSMLLAAQVSGQAVKMRGTDACVADTALEGISEVVVK